MIKENLSINNNIRNNYLNKGWNKRLISLFDKNEKQIKREINYTKNFYNFLSTNFKLSFKLKDLQGFKKYNSIVIIGMGGSILGSEAIYCFLREKIKKEIFFFDDIDIQKIKKLKSKNNNNKTLFLIISKSGNTIETISNLIFLNILKKKAKNVILISEKKNNFLHTVSKELDIFFVEHKNYIGGRYSIFSEAGLIPAYFMGVDILGLRKNLKKNFDKKRKKILRESSIKLSNILLKRKITNLILLNYSPKLDKFMYWCQQLIAESLGKMNKGFLPTISNVPKDHHSLLQLYLDGPKDKMYYFFSLDERDFAKIKINKKYKQFSYLRNKSLQKIKDAQKNSLIKVFRKRNIPFREFKIKTNNAETIGELFSYFILETILIGKIAGLNPFDQPAVEQVKLSTKKILKQKSRK